MNKKMMNKWIFGAALLLFAACTQDELTEQGDTLPEGVYPLEISSVTLEAEVSTQPWGEDGPQTRVSENNPDRNSSKWDGVEVITVQLGDNQTTTYKVVDTDGTLERTGDQLYWAKREDNVTAWYPANGEIRLDNQQDGNLAYVLKATTEKASYDKSVSLNFTHQLAKIRVKVEGEKAGSVIDVKIESYTSCTNTNGEVKGNETSVSEITMYKVYDKTYEANVAPGRDITRFKVNGGEWVNLSKTVTPVAGNYHEITVAAKKAWPNEVNSGEYTISGESSQTVKLSGDATLILDGAVSRGAETAIRVTGGSPTIVVKGTKNDFQCSKTPILLDPDANVTIKGYTNNAEDNKLIVQAGDFCTGIGAAPGSDGNNIPKACGNITIENITLHANGSFGGGNKAGAGIGTPGGNAGSCGDITIKNSVVYARGGQGAAAIGTGCNVYCDVSCGKITINHSQIYATVDYFYAIDYLNGYAAGIGHGAWLGNHITGTVGEIVITTDEEKDEFFSSDRFKRADGVTTGFYKVGKGTCTSDVGTQVWSGVTFNGESLATKDDNGYPTKL